MKINREEFLSSLEMVRAGLSTREFIEQSSCLSADSTIHTLEGDFTIRELLRQKKTSFEVFSTDGKRLVIGKAFGLRLTKKNAPVVQVLFDTGHSIKVTSDHLIMMRDCTYKEAGSLCEGDSVLPFNRHFDGNYAWVYPNLYVGRERLHVWAFEQHNGRKAGLVHHKDDNVWNNSKENLQEMTREEHGRYHGKINMPGKLPHARAVNSKRMMGNKISAPKKPWLSVLLKGNKNGVGGPGGGCTSEGAKRGWEKRRANGFVKSRPNHKVVCVLPAGNEDVYDLSVHEFHNFAVNGIFVHNCFAFQEGEVMTFNDEIACRKRIGFEVTGAVQAQALLDILGKLKEDDILAVRQNGNKELEFRGHKEAFGVPMDAEIFLPIERVEKAKDWREVPSQFLEAIRRVQHCVSQDESRFMLTCIHLHPQFIEACNNLQLMRYSVDTGLESSVLVRGTSLQPLLDLGMTELAQTKSWIHFRNKKKLIFSCRQYTEKYPSLDKLLEVNGSKLTLPKGVVDVTERANVFAADRAGDPLVGVKLSEGKIRVTGRGYAGWYKGVREVDYSGPTMRFLISPELLQFICEQYSSAEIGEDKLKAMGRDKEKKKLWTYVAALGGAEEDEEDSAIRKKGPHNRSQEKAKRGSDEAENIDEEAPER